MINYLIAGLIAILLIIYLVLIPIFRYRQQRQTKQRMDKFFSSLVVNDRVVLSDGIIGRIRTLTSQQVRLEIANGVVVNVNKYAIISKVKEEAAKDHGSVQATSAVGKG